MLWKTSEVVTMREIKFDIRKTMTKKAFKEMQKNSRNLNGFNTGTRDMKSAKSPSRSTRKAETRKIAKEY